MLCKLDSDSNGCHRVAEVSLQADLVSAALARHSACVMEVAYQGVPLAELSASSRGRRIERIVRAVDQDLHPGAVLAAPALGTCTDGQRCTRSSAAYDWIRDGRRIECKSGQLRWEPRSSRWRVQFHHVKLWTSGEETVSFFDELLLALYTPGGIHVYRYALDLGTVRAGVATETRGGSIYFHGPSNVACWDSALAVITARLEAAGCHRLAWVKW